MRKRRVQVVVGLALIVLAFIVLGVGAMLAFFVLFCVGSVVLLIARLYPADRALEDKHERDDSF
jgi:hypothetical protein